MSAPPSRGGARSSSVSWGAFAQSPKHQRSLCGSLKRTGAEPAADRRLSGLAEADGSLLFSPNRRAPAAPAGIAPHSAELDEPLYAAPDIHMGRADESSAEDMVDLASIEGTPRVTPDVGPVYATDKGFTDKALANEPRGAETSDLSLLSIGDGALWNSPGTAGRSSLVSSAEFDSLEFYTEPQAEAQARSPRGGADSSFGSGIATPVGDDGAFDSKPVPAAPGDAVQPVYQNVLPSVGDASRGHGITYQNITLVAKPPLAVSDPYDSDSDDPEPAPSPGKNASPGKYGFGDGDGDGVGGAVPPPAIGPIRSPRSNRSSAELDRPLKPAEYSTPADSIHREDTGTLRRNVQYC